MTRRPGLTLMEVLVTLVILTFGILAILTLFPLAASQMAIAVREDRSAQAAANADAFFRSQWKTQVVEQPNGGVDPFFQALTNPDAQPLNGVPNSSPHGLAAFPPNPNEWSYPVLVDPMGFVAPRAAPQWLGDSAGTNVSRRSLNLISQNPTNPQFYSMRACSLPDSMSYDDDGRPVRSTTNLATGPTWIGQADREWRYNWAWIVQRPVNGNLFAANLTVIVFDNRPPAYAPTGAEAVFSAQFTPNSATSAGSTSVVVTNNPTPGNPSGVPDVKPGGWIMDATVTTPASGRILRHANLYQVVSVTPAGTSTILELQTTVKPASDNQPGTYNGTMVVLRGVSGVYPRPMLQSGN